MPEFEVSIVIPCLDEEQTLKPVVDNAVLALQKYGYKGEVIVADNGSTDNSVAIAEGCGARVVNVQLRGYGSALSRGIYAAEGRYVVIGDADGSYDFNQINRFIDSLSRNHEFVMGTRLKGEIEPGAMPYLNRHLGTPVLTALINIFFGTKFSDCNCGIRGFTRDAFCRLAVHTTGMEWASETIIKASLIKLKMDEVPVTLRVDKRNRPPHLRPWRDGWHHLRFILTYAADKILFVPGLLLIGIGVLGFSLLYQHPLRLPGFFMDYHFLFPSAMALMLGVQVVMFSFLTKTYTGLAQYNTGLSRLLRLFTFEWGIILGSLFILLGLLINLVIIGQWIQSYGHGLFAVRPAIIALTCMAVGFQLVFNCFFMSAMQIPQTRIIEDEPPSLPQPMK